MAGLPELRYGTPNFEMIRGWLSLPADQDGPFWVVNLMKCRTVADDGDGSYVMRVGRFAGTALTDANQSDEPFVMTLPPTIDKLVTSILTAPSPGRE